MAAKTFEEILKFNPYHDSRGRFSTADAATLFTIRTQDPSKQHLAEGGILREKERDAAEVAARNAETPQMKAIHDVEDRIRHQDFESSACVDKDGNVLFFKDGEKSEVNFTRAECLVMKDNILTHNHPGSSMFSQEDVDLWAVWNLQGIRATNREGITYSIERGEGYTPEKGDGFRLNFTFDNIKAKYKAQEVMADNGVPWKLQNGEMTQEQANAEYRKAIATELAALTTKAAPKFGINFTVEKREVTKSAGTPIYTAKASDGSEIVAVLDKKTEDDITASFNEWLERALKNPTAKTAKSCDTITEVEKFNPYHDQLGRFATADGATVFTYAPGKSKAHDNAIAREKERHAAGGSAYEKALDEEQAKVLAMAPNEQALYVFEHHGETEDNCVAAMNNGETEALVKNYFAVMKANGDPPEGAL